VKRYVTDTQCLLWHMARDRHLPKAVRSIFEATENGQAQVLVPSICLVEALFLLQRQRVPQTIVERLLQLPEHMQASLRVVPLDMAVVHAVADFGPAAVPELADRVIAATARALNLPLLTVDHAIVRSGLVDVID
jgi:PIN domain nuclease of toxin-antitoxin system